MIKENFKYKNIVNKTEIENIYFFNTKSLVYFYNSYTINHTYFSYNVQAKVRFCF